MGSQLDIDDVTHDHPLAKAQLEKMCAELLWKTEMIDRLCAELAAAEKERDEARGLGEWTSVFDAQPPAHQTVLVTGGGIVHIGKVLDEVGDDIPEGGYWSVNPTYCHAFPLITHWMFLPDPPQGEYLGVFQTGGKGSAAGRVVASLLRRANRRESLGTCKRCAGPLVESDWCLNCGQSAALRGGG